MIRRSSPVEAQGEGRYSLIVGRPGSFTCSGPPSRAQELNGPLSNIKQRELQTAVPDEGCERFLTSAPRSLLLPLLGLAALCVLALGACGSDEGAGNPDSELSTEQASAPLEDAPPQLVAIRDQANELLDGGTEAFDGRLAELRGTPVVVNKWASWCGPCRLEFPFFQSQADERGAEVAFLGVLSDDSEDAGATFLEELPLPYPSYIDPDQEIAAEIDGAPELPRDRASTTRRASSSTRARAATPTSSSSPPTSSATRASDTGLQAHPKPRDAMSDNGGRGCRNRDRRGRRAAAARGAAAADGRRAGADRRRGPGRGGDRRPGRGRRRAPTTSARG